MRSQLPCQCKAPRHVIILEMFRCMERMSEKGFIADSPPLTSYPQTSTGQPMPVEAFGSLAGHPACVQDQKDAVPPTAEAHAQLVARQPTSLAAPGVVILEAAHAVATTDAEPVQRVEPGIAPLASPMGRQPQRLPDELKRHMESGTALPDAITGRRSIGAVQTLFRPEQIHPLAHRQ